MARISLEDIYNFITGTNTTGTDIINTNNGPKYNKKDKSWYNSKGEKLSRLGYYNKKANIVTHYNSDGTVTKLPLNEYMKIYNEWNKSKVIVKDDDNVSRFANVKDTYSDGQYRVLPSRKHKGSSKDSENVEDFIINRLYNTYSQYYDTKFQIPYGKEVIKINEKPYSRNELDSLMLNAGRARVSIRDAVGLTFETHNGKLPAVVDSWFTDKDLYVLNKPISLRNVYNANVFKNYGVIPAAALVNFEMKNTSPEKVSPLFIANDLYARGLYNTGEKNKHTKRVTEEGNRIVDDSNFKKYLKERGDSIYNKGYNQTKYTQQMWNDYINGFTEQGIDYLKYIHKAGKNRNVYYDKHK
uniref:Uncharacterized protein n=1 Tax=Geladintestivirus 2 TaxID=3233134 RepID=A0AAU8MIL9_9CAUD